MKDSYKINWKRFREWLTESKEKQWILILGVVGILLIALSEWIPFKKETDSTDMSLTTVAYTQQLEQELEELVTSIEGAGECRVMVTLENGVEYIYATEEKNDNNYKQDGTTVDSRENSAQSVIVVNDVGLLVTEVMPTVQGVVVVCEGGGDETVRQNISEAIGTVLHISQKRVCVLKQS